MKPQDIAPNPVNILLSIRGRVELNNKSDEEVTLELFDKKNGCSIISNKGAFFTLNNIECNIIMAEHFLSPEIEIPYKQSYQDFMESLIEQGGLIIQKFDSTDNSRVKIYQKDLIKGTMEYKWHGGPILLLGRTLIIVKLFARQKFEMNFEVPGKQFKRNDSEFTSAC